MNELDHRILAAKHEFICAETSEEKCHKWRKMRDLIVRRANRITAEQQEIAESVRQDI